MYPAIIPKFGFKYTKINVQCYIMGSGFGQVRCIYGSSDCGAARDRQSGDEPVAPNWAGEKPYFCRILKIEEKEG